MDAMERHPKSATEEGTPHNAGQFLQACQRGRRWYEPLVLRFCILKMHIQVVTMLSLLSIQTMIRNQLLTTLI